MGIGDELNIEVNGEILWESWQCPQYSTDRLQRKLEKWQFWRGLQLFDMDAIYPITTLNHSYKIAVNLSVYTVQKVWYNILLQAVIGEHGKSASNWVPKKWRHWNPAQVKDVTPGRSNVAVYPRGEGRTAVAQVKVKTNKESGEHNVVRAVYWWALARVPVRGYEARATKSGSSKSNN